MLDAYIIERIRREKALEQQERARLPLHIERHPISSDDHASDEPKPTDRGSQDIDFQM